MEGDSILLNRTEEAIHQAELLSEGMMLHQSEQAFHLELLMDRMTESFILTIKRKENRRGKELLTLLTNSYTILNKSGKGRKIVQLQDNWMMGLEGRAFVLEFQFSILQPLYPQLMYYSNMC